MTIRDLYLATSQAAVDLLRHPALPDRWDQPSLLAEFTVSGLAAHLSRAILQVDTFLADGAAAGRTDPPITGARYFAQLEGTGDLASPLNEGIRARADAEATGGPAAVADRAAAALARLRSRLPGEPADQRVVARGDVLLLDDYLRTRLVEITVHCEDLALSLGLPAEAVPLPDAALTEAIQLLVETALDRHGARAVLRALTRRERDTPDALRIF